MISNCSGKLKPYLLEFSQSVGTHLNRYSKAVASICQEHLDGVELNDANASDEIMVCQNFPYLINYRIFWHSAALKVEHGKL